MKARFFLLLFVPFSALFIFGLFLINSKTQDLNHHENASQESEIVRLMANLDANLGQEAIDLTLYLDPGINRSSSNWQKLQGSLDETDNSLEELEEYIQSKSYPRIHNVVEDLKNILIQREDIRRKEVTPLQVIDRYSTIRKRLVYLLEISFTELDRNHQEINYLISKIQTRGAHLDERIIVQLALRNKIWAPGQYPKLISAIAVQDSYIQDLEIGISPDERLEDIRSNITNPDQSSQLSESEWVELSNDWLSKLNLSIENDLEDLIEMHELSKNSSAEQRNFMLLAFILSLLFTSIISTITVFEISKRVKEVTNQAKLLADGEKVAYVSVGSNKDELSQLALAFNETARRIEKMKRLTFEVEVMESIAKEDNINSTLLKITEMLGKNQDESLRYEFKHINSFDNNVKNRYRVVPDTEICLVSSQDHPLTTPLVDLAVSLARLAKSQAEGRSRLRYQATRDDLTGLLNRPAILDKCELVLNTSTANQAGFFYIDLDGFKEVNDRYGHGLGDSLLKIQGERIAKFIDGFEGSNSAAGRLGGDEFLVVLENVQDINELETFGCKLAEILSESMNIEENVFSVGASIGCSSSSSSQDLTTLLQLADTALYQAKDQMKGSVVVATDELLNSQLAQEELKNYFRLAIEKDEISLWFQPIWDVESNSILALEALARWDSAERGIITPDVFLPLAEELDLLAVFDYMIVQKSIDQLISWNSRGFDLPKLHINISASTIDKPDFTKNILSIISTRDCPLDRLVLEITETQRLVDLELASSHILLLRDKGIQIAIDDFGKGYSSLEYIQKLSLDVVKLDKSLVENLSNSRSNRAIISAILTITSQLEIVTVVEGVEDSEDLQTLKQMGVNYMQGYLFFRPMPLAEIEVFLGELSSNESSLRSNFVNFSTESDDFQSSSPSKLESS